jgi:hypothetical protein
MSIYDFSANTITGDEQSMNEVVALLGSPSV